MDRYRNIFFLGIGGIGMSALAQYCIKSKKKVAGYDSNQSNITDLLQDKGADIFFEEDITKIPQSFLDPKDTLIVLTKAISECSKLLIHFKSRGFTILKRSEVLGSLTKEKFCFSVAGSNGKTTTTAILTHILKTAKVKFSAFVGGIMRNYSSNFIYDGDGVIVVEADEYDRSFLHVHSDIACVTSMELDHTDIYPVKEDMVGAFHQFISNLKPNGKLVVEQALQFSAATTYGIDDLSDVKAINLKIIISKDTKMNITSFPYYYQFDLQYKGGIIKNIIFPYLGLHNLKNALGAISMVLQYHISENSIKEALKTFKGVERRFNFYKLGEKIVIDDYAHHPEGIEAMSEALRKMFPNEQITVLFQPHLYSRTQAFSDQFARALSQFDEVMLMDIYPARELPIEGITSEWLLSKVNKQNKRIVSKRKLKHQLNQSKNKIILSIGAGDISSQIRQIVS